MAKIASRDRRAKAVESEAESAKAVEFEEENEDPRVKGQPSKRRRKVVVAKVLTSYVWKHFDVLKVEEGNRAKCKYCKKTNFRAEGFDGLSNCKSHLTICKAYEVSLTENSDDDFDPEVYCEMFADAIVTHGYSLSIVKDEKLRELHVYLNPKVLTISVSAVLEKVKALIADWKKTEKVGVNVETNCVSDVESM